LLIFFVFYALKLQNRRNKKNQISNRNTLIGTISLNIILTLILLLHFLETLFIDIGNYNLRVYRYNNFFKEKTYQYLLFDSLNASQILNIVRDSLIWMIVIYLFFLLLIWFRYEEHRYRETRSY